MRDGSKPHPPRLLGYCTACDYPVYGELPLQCPECGHQPLALAASPAGWRRSAHSFLRAAAPLIVFAGLVAVLSADHRQRHHHGDYVGAYHLERVVELGPSPDDKRRWTLTLLADGHYRGGWRFSGYHTARLEDSTGRMAAWSVGSDPPDTMPAHGDTAGSHSSSVATSVDPDVMRILPLVSSVRHSDRATSAPGGRGSISTRQLILWDELGSLSVTNGTREVTESGLDIGFAIRVRGSRPISAAWTYQRSPPNLGRWLISMVLVPALIGALVTYLVVRAMPR